MPTCQTADMSFIDRASVKEVNVVELPGTPEQVFAVFEDEQSWPVWFKGITKVTWTSPRPYGVGTTRTVELGLLSVDEYFFEWEDNKHFAFYFTATNLPFVKALVEVYQLEAIDEHTTRFTYTVAYDPAVPLKLTGPVGRAMLARTFKRGANSLVDYVKQRV